MSQAAQAQWRWDPQSQRWYFYDSQNDTLVFENGSRVPRPQNIPRNAFTLASAQAAATPSPSSYASNPIPSSPGYVASTPGSQYYQTTVRRDAQPGSSAAAASRGQLPYQDPTRASSSQVDALAQNLGGMTVSTQHQQPGQSRHPQPVTPRVRFGEQGQRIVEAADPKTNLRTIIQTAPVTAITDPALLQSGIFARSRLLPAADDVTERLFKSFRLRDQPRKFFTVGKVFLVLWVEPAGESNTGVTGLEIGTTIGRFGERAFSKVRRFVVVREGDNYCSALPITSYGHRGVGKPGVNKSEHSIIHTSKTPPAPLAAELPSRGEDGMRDQAIRVDTDDPIDKLDSLSRLDYGKVHTIQHNIKVKSFGKVNPKSMYALINQFGNVWRALPNTGPIQAQRAVQKDDHPTAHPLRSTTGTRHPAETSARAAPAPASSTRLLTRTAVERAPAETDRAAQVQADVRAAVQALIRQGHTEQEAERAIRAELARRRAAQQDDHDDDDDDDDDGEDESSDEDEGATGAQTAATTQQHSSTQGQQSSSSQGRSGSTQQSSTRTPAGSQGTSSRSHGQSQSQPRSTGASASSQAQAQANRAQVNALMQRLLQDGKSQEEALAIVRSRISSGRSV